MMRIMNVDNADANLKGTIALLSGSFNCTQEIGKSAENVGRTYSGGSNTFSNTREGIGDAKRN